MSDADQPANHPIQVVARRTGLTADLIRAWERRYQAVSPHRSDNSRRQYSDEDIEKLNLLKRATQAGRRIGDVANLSVEQLYSLVETDESAVLSNQLNASVRPTTGSVMEHFEECLDAVNQLDTGALKNSLVRAANSLGIQFLLEDLLRPLIAHIKDECRQGTMRRAQEQLGIAIIRAYLGTLIAPEHTNNHNHSKLIVTTPPGQENDLIALRIAVAANSYGWSSVYLGTCLPNEEIYFAIQRTHAKVLALGLSKPADDPYLPNTLRRLRNNMDPTVTILVAGSSVTAYSEVLSEINAITLATLGELRIELDKLKRLRI